jgi:hypothetical protein
LRAEIDVALASPRSKDYYRDTGERVLDKTIQLIHILDQMLTLARGRKRRTLAIRIHQSSRSCGILTER